MHFSNVMYSFFIVTDNVNVCVFAGVEWCLPSCVRINRVFLTCLCYRTVAKEEEKKEAEEPNKEEAEKESKEEKPAETPEEDKQDEEKKEEL